MCECLQALLCLSVRLSVSHTWPHTPRVHVESSLAILFGCKPSRNLFSVNFICALLLYQWLICFFQHKFPFFEPWTHAQLHVFNFGNVNVKFRMGLYSANRGNAGSSVVLNYSVPPVLTVFLHYLFTVFRTGCIKLSSVQWEGGDIRLTFKNATLLNKYWE